MDKTAYFPFFIDIKGKSVIVFGGGKIAARRVGVLLDFGCKVTVAAPLISDDLLNLDKLNSNLVLVYKTFDEWKLENKLTRENYFCVLAATNDSFVNQSILNAAKQEGLIVNVCDNPSDCDFYFPAIVRSDDIVIGVCGNGKNHSKVKEIAAKLRSVLQLR